MHTTKPTILILTAHTGGGHVNLAQSLKEILGASYNVIIADPFPKAVDRWYANVSRHDLPFLSRQFRYTDNAFASFWVHHALALLLYYRLRKSIERIQPQLIITTHALFSYAIANTLARSRKHIPLVFQLTDLEYIHSTWFTEKRADAYLAPTREIFAQALKRDIDPKRLYTTGRPVRRQFLDVSAATKSETLATLNFNPTICTIFIQGGAKGSAQVDGIITYLLHTGVPVQILLAVGNNADMAASYANVEQVHTIPFTETIAPYMAAADIIIGKAGASFVSEAFMLEKPFLVTAVIPDQETPTLAFIERYNLGWVCLELVDQQTLLLEILQDSTKIAEKVDAIRAYKNWNRQANQEIRTIIDRLLA